MNTLTNRARILSIVAVAAALSTAAIGNTQSVQAAPPRNAPTSPVESFPTGQLELTTTDLETWLDGFMPTALRANDIAGAVVQVVKDGEVSDVATGTPVDPQQTLFQVASVSKTFTWTAVMQLVEQGKIDLDADINDYLDFVIEGKGAPITIRNLMTHTAGFEELGKNPLYYKASDVIPLGSFLKQNVPGRIFAPGSTPAYSNYGAALAGYIVQRVSGRSFDDYMDRNIFEPLGMTSSSFRQPLPAALQDRFSLGYLTASEPPHPFEYLSDAPAGSLATTADDMGRFMIEHLQNETPGGGKLLNSETATLMHRTVTKENSGMNGHALGFYEQNRNGQKVIAHGGDLTVFHTQMELYLDEGVGILVSYNSAGTNATDLRGDLMTAFADRYFPETGAIGSDARAGVEQAIAVQHANEVAGSYLISRRFESSFFKVGNIISQVTLVANADGSVTLNGPGITIRGVEISPHLWQQPGTDKLFAVSTEGGSMRLTPNPTIVLDRLPTLETTLVRGSLLGLAVLSLLVTVLSWPIAALMRRRYRVARAWQPGERRAVIARLIASVLMVVATGAWLGQVLTVLGGAALSDGLLITTQVLAIVCAVTAALLAIVSLLSTVKHRRDRFRVATTLVWTLALVFLLVQFADLNLFRVSNLY